MNTYEIPRNYKGEGRILYIFSTKGLIYTVVGLVIGLVFYFIFKVLGMSVIGIGIDVLFGVVGFVIGTLKMPDTRKFEFTKKTGGENIDNIIKRWIKFKRNNNKIYIREDVLNKQQMFDEQGGKKDGEWSNKSNSYDYTCIFNYNIIYIINRFYYLNC